MELLAHRSNPEISIVQCLDRTSFKIPEMRLEAILKFVLPAPDSHIRFLSIYFQMWKMVRALPIACKALFTAQCQQLWRNWRDKKTKWVLLRKPCIPLRLYLSYVNHSDNVNKCNGIQNRFIHTLA